MWLLTLTKSTHVTGLDTGAKGTYGSRENEDQMIDLCMIYAPGSDYRWRRSGTGAGLAIRGDRSTIRERSVWMKEGKVFEVLQGEEARGVSMEKRGCGLG